jgi:hypothetical protein
VDDNFENLSENVVTVETKVKDEEKPIKIPIVVDDVKYGQVVIAPNTLQKGWSVKISKISNKELEKVRFFFFLFLLFLFFYSSILLFFELFYFPFTLFSFYSPSKRKRSATNLQTKETQLLLTSSQWHSKSKSSMRTTKRSRSIIILFAGYGEGEDGNIGIGYTDSAQDNWKGLGETSSEKKRR